MRIELNFKYRAAVDGETGYSYKRTRAFVKKYGVIFTRKYRVANNITLIFENM